MKYSRNIVCLFIALAVPCLFAGCGDSAETDQPVVATDDSGNAMPEGTGSTSSTAPPFPELAPGERRPAVTGTEAAQRYLAASEQLLKEGQAQQALEALTRAIQADPKLQSAYIKRADFPARANLLPQAVNDLTQALRLNADDPKLFNSRGFLLLTLKKYDAAISDFDSAVALDLSYTAPLNNRGLARLSAGEGEKSLLDFDAALRIDPKYVDALNNRGYVLLQLERNTEAIETLTRAIELQPDYINAWNNRGIAHKQAEMSAEAVKDFTRAIELQPTQARYYLHRKEAYESLGQTAEAAADGDKADWLNELARLNQQVLGTPNDAERWLYRAAHLVDGAEYDTALKDLERALHLNPDLAAAYTVRAKVYLAKGDQEKAIQEATRALATKPHHEAYSLRGDAYFAQKNYEAAIADYQQARRLDEQVQLAFKLRAEQLEGEGNIQQASYYREQATGISNAGASRTEKPAPASRVLPLPTTAETGATELN